MTSVAILARRSKGQGNRLNFTVSDCLEKQCYLEKTMRASPDVDIGVHAQFFAEDNASSARYIAGRTNAEYQPVLPTDISSSDTEELNH